MTIALTLYYATNRNHQGASRWRPTSYGKKFSDDGMENLRFGKVTVEADETEIRNCLAADVRAMGKGNGEALSGYLAGQAKSAQIQAFPEQLSREVSDTEQPDAKLGSKAMFAEIQQLMMKQTDIVIFIHGFNVSWFDAVGSALALELMLNNSASADAAQKVSVVLFTWPSDGLALPFASYKSDRTEAAGSGYAVARGLLKMRDFLAALRDRAVRQGQQLCHQDIHLLCHSMGNFLLQNTISRIDDHTPGNALPRLFEHVFLCAPDVDDGVLETGGPLGRVHELARCVTVYHNRGDVALVISDHTKANPERLGANGAARPSMLHNKVHQLDCTPIVSGLSEHSYYVVGHVSDDIRMSIDGVSLGDPKRRRIRDPNVPNIWTIR